MNDHGFIPEGSHVYHLEMVGDVSGVKQHYIAKTGTYLQGGGDKAYDESKESVESDSDTESDATDDNSNDTGSSSTDTVENNEVLSI